MVGFMAEVNAQGLDSRGNRLLTLTGGTAEMKLRYGPLTRDEL